MRDGVNPVGSATYDGSSHSDNIRNSMVQYFFPIVRTVSRSDYSEHEGSFLEVSSDIEKIGGTFYGFESERIS